MNRLTIFHSPQTSFHKSFSMKRLSILLIISVLATFSAFGQNPFHWSFEAKDAGNGQADLVIKCTIDEPFHTYSQFVDGDDGPVPTTLTFKEGPHFQLIGKAVESGGKTTEFDKVFGIKITFFSHTAVFTQRVKIIDATKPIVGFVEAMACDDKMCLPPTQFDFSIAPPAAPKGGNSNPAATQPIDNHQIMPKTGENSHIQTGHGQPENFNQPPPAANSGESVTPPPGGPGGADPNFQGFFETHRGIDASKVVNTCGLVATENSSLWKIFIGGFIGGLLALLTPCVFPMLPMTVGYFTKGGRDKKKGLRDAIIYGLSIIVLYTGIGLALVGAFGPKILNEMASNVWFNTAFFVVFLLFALSFFGMFEITLPASWSTKTDKMADQGGYLGIFFMAATLAIVSFSCTGPIVGTLLVQTAQGAGQMLFGRIPIEPVVGMFGFSLALALPFALFAGFPSWLKTLPKSGGWMDNVKITLAFLELALAFKFLSTADLVQHWGILKFELFLGLWILICLLLAAYQFGLLKWIKGAAGRPGLGRLTVGGLSLGLAIYMILGLVNYRSMSLLSGIAPPVGYNFFRPTACPHNLNCFHDFDEAQAYAQKVNKPLFVDFTGHSCVNCRKMEENVWDKPEILKFLEDDYVVVSLYVDDRRELFPDDKFKYLLDPKTGEKIKSDGDKWSSFQISNFGETSQPMYALMHHDGKTLLTKPDHYNPDVEKYRQFLQCGLDGFESLKNGVQPVLGLK